MEENLRRLLDQFKSGTYKAPPVRRAYIPKADGGQRPLGVPTFEDKVLQRAVTMVLETVYEQDFLPSSYGYRPGTGALYALRDLRQELMSMGGGWVLEADIRSFFDRMAHQHLRSFLDGRVRDGVIRRAIDKWLKAGVMEEGRIHFPEDGSPQGGVISPLLANIYLHEVLDVWFETVVKPRMRGRTRLIRYADDFVICFQREDDARRVVEVLPKRLAKYGLTLHPDKTRLFRYRVPDEGGHGHPPTFDFLGFTHYWARSRAGRWVIKRKTIAKRLARKTHEIWMWCRQNRHEPLEWQRKRLASRLLGYYNHFGIPCNAGALDELFRSTGMALLAEPTSSTGHDPVGRLCTDPGTLSASSAAHRSPMGLNRPQRIHGPKSRMRETRTSGSVGAGRATAQSTRYTKHVSRTPDTSRTVQPGFKIADVPFRGAPTPAVVPAPVQNMQVARGDETYV